MASLVLGLAQGVHDHPLPWVSAADMNKNLMHRVEPVYPQIAKAAQIQGDVHLHAVISRQGTVKNLSALTGHAILCQAAMDAVRQWTFKPFEQNGKPVDVQAEITIKFHK